MRGSIILGVLAALGVGAYVFTRPSGASTGTTTTTTTTGPAYANPCAQSFVALPTNVQEAVGPLVVAGIANKDSATLRSAATQIRSMSPSGTPVAGGAFDVAATCLENLATAVDAGKSTQQSSSNKLSTGFNHPLNALGPGSNLGPGGGSGVSWSNLNWASDPIGALAQVNQSAADKLRYILSKDPRTVTPRDVQALLDIGKLYPGTVPAIGKYLLRTGYPNYWSLESPVGGGPATSNPAVLASIISGLQNGTWLRPPDNDPAADLAAYAVPFGS